MTFYIQNGLRNNVLKPVELNRPLLEYLSDFYNYKVVPSDVSIKDFKVKEADYFIAGELIDGNYTRNNANLKGRDFAVLDFDSLHMSENDFLSLVFDKLKVYSYCLYPTISYSKESPRYRLIVELNKLANKNEYVNVISSIYNLIGIQGDLSASTFSQLQGLPIANQVNKDDYKIIYNKGQPFIVEETRISVSLDDDEAINIFNKYMGNEADKLQERNDYYLSVIATLCKSVISKQISYETGIMCCEILAGDNEEWRANNVEHFNSELNRANGDINYFTTALDFFTKFRDTQNFIKAIDQITGKAIQITTDGDGKPLKTLPNYRNMFKSMYSVALNTLNHSIEIIKGSGGVKQEFDKTMLEVIRLEIAEKYNISISKDNLTTIIIATAKQFQYSPINNIIQARKWDGVERAEKVFIEYLGAEDTFYNREITRKILLAGVYRTYEPGCKFDEVLILKGGQGIGKSTAVERLACGYFVKIQGEIDKETELKTQEAWIVELEELDALKRTKSTKIKGWISNRIDKIRPPYEMKYKDRPRQFVIIGTTNEKEFLKDRTGNRRYWVMECNKQPFTSIFNMSDEYIYQIWAEVYQWYLNKETLLISEDTHIKMEELSKGALLLDELEYDLIDLLELEMPKDWQDMMVFDTGKVENIYRVKSYVQDMLNVGKTEYFADKKKVKINDITTKEIHLLLFEDTNTQNLQGNVNNRKIKRIMDNMDGWTASDYVKRGNKRFRGYKREITH